MSSLTDRAVFAVILYLLFISPCEISFSIFLSSLNCRLAFLEVDVQHGWRAGSGSGDQCMSASVTSPCHSETGLSEPETCRRSVIAKCNVKLQTSVNETYLLFQWWNTYPHYNWKLLKNEAAPRSGSWLWIKRREKNEINVICWDLQSVSVRLSDGQVFLKN